MFLPSKYEYCQMIKEREGKDLAYYYKQDFSTESRLLITQLFRSFIRNEAIFEGQRRVLRLCSKEAFKLIQNETDGIFLTKNNFKWFLEDMCIFPSVFETDVLFRRFDKNRDEKVSFSQVI